MANQVCLLCLHVFDNDNARAKSPEKIRFETLRKLLTVCHHDYKSVPESDLDGDEICNLCADCYPLFSTMEEIRTQISLLEDQIGTQIKQIQTIIGESSSSQLGNNGMDKIVQIRDMIFNATGGNEEEQLRENFLFHDEDDVQVKEELDDIDPLGDVGDQFFDGYYNSYSEPSIEKEEVEDFIRDEDYETEFCIVPDPQTNLTIPNEDNPKCYMTRKREDFSPPPSKITKRKKLQPDREPTPEAITPRFSPRVKKRTSRRPVSSPTSDAILPRLHKCTSCSKSFTCIRSLSMHIARSHGLTCIAPLCTATFHSVKLRDAHLRTAHEGLTTYKCPICGTKFSYQTGLAAHMVMRHENGDKKLSCVKCGKKFCLEENLARHLSLHDLEGIKPLVCDVCDDRFEDDERLKKHMAIINHSKPFPCSQCPRKCASRTDLERHLKTHSKEKTDKCPHCDFIAAVKYTLKDHIARMHPVGPATHICHVCGKGFHLPVDLKVHLVCHDTVTCDTCGETFSTSRTLQSHHIKVHGKDPFVCDECGATFIDARGFKAHKKDHASGKRHKCETCGACFTHSWGLRHHMRTHTGERPFPCPHCDKAFPSSGNLRKHVNAIHTPGYVVPAPHKCPHCDKSCRTPFFLKCHIRQAHTGERPFTCDQCGKGFAVNSALATHLKSAHGVVLMKKRKDRLARSKKDAFHHVEEDRD